MKNLRKRIAVMEKALECQKKQLPVVMREAKFSLISSTDRKSVDIFQELLSAAGATAVGRPLTTRELKAWREYHLYLRLACRRAGVAVRPVVDRASFVDSMIEAVLTKTMTPWGLDGVQRAMGAVNRGDTPAEGDAAELARCNEICKRLCELAVGKLAIDDLPDGLPIPPQ